MTTKFESMTRDALRVECKQRNLVGYGSKNKEGLIAMLRGGAPKKAARSPRKSAAQAQKKRKKAAKFVESERRLYDVPLAAITGNSVSQANRIPVLSRQGFTIFPAQKYDDEHTLWTMLNGTPGAPPNEELRAEAVRLIEQFEPEIALTARSMEDDPQPINPPTIIFRNEQVEIETGMLRCLARSYRDARAQQPPGLITSQYDPKRSDIASMKRCLIENIDRYKPQALALARQMEFFKRELKWTNEQIGDKLGCSDQTVANYLKLLTVSEEVQDDLQRRIDEGEITLTGARDIVEELEQDASADDAAIDAAANRTTQKKQARKSIPFKEVFATYQAESDPHTRDVLLNLMKMTEAEAEAYAHARLVADTLSIWDDDESQGVPDEESSAGEEWEDVQ